MSKEPDFLGDVLKIALGITLGGVMLFVLANVYFGYQLRAFSRAASSELSSMVEKAEGQAAAAKAAAEASRLQELRRKAANTQRAADVSRAADVAEAQREAAWKRFYQPRPACLESSSVECGNEHIRARREFESRYASGQFN